MALPSMPSVGPLPKQAIPLVAAIVAAGGFVLYAGKAREASQLQGKLVATQGQLAETRTENEQLKEDLRRFEADKSNLEKLLTSVRAQLTTSTTEVEKARESLREFESRFEELREQRAQLQTQLASMTSERDQVNERLQKTEQEKGELQRAVGRMRERLTLLDRDYRQLSDKLAEAENRPNSSLSVVSSSAPISSGAASSGATQSAAPSTIAGAVELPPIIVRRDQAGMSTTVRGRVLEVSEPHHFVVLDKGSMDGVRVGMSFDILRGSAPVGRAMVVRVRPQLSACDVVRGKTAPGGLQVGDTAIQNSP